MAIEENTNPYLDGSEDRLVEAYKNKDSAELERLSRSGWQYYYHITDIRENLLSWYEFSKDESLLEVGAGCGALTGLFCRKLGKVAAVELSQKRASVIEARCQDYKNLTVYTSDINKIKGLGKFDYATSIGVLEYAGKYSDSSEPYRDFLISLRKHLKKNGKLLLAIENKYGLKYWSGVAEDHTGRFFDSIEGYPDGGDIKTFSKKELVELLMSSGYSNIDFYYPLPDYKLPQEVFSDNYLPSKGHMPRSGSYPYPDPSRKRETLFNEKAVMEGLIENDMFDFFANSFLVVAEVEK